jgi:hypothetical protein
MVKERLLRVVEIIFPLLVEVAFEASLEVAVAEGQMEPGPEFEGRYSLFKETIIRKYEIKSIKLQLQRTGSYRNTRSWRHISPQVFGNPLRIVTHLLLLGLRLHLTRAGPGSGGRFGGPASEGTRG